MTPEDWKWLELLRRNGYFQAHITDFDNLCNELRSAWEQNEKLEKALEDAPNPKLADIDLVLAYAIWYRNSHQALASSEKTGR